MDRGCPSKLTDGTLTIDLTYDDYGRMATRTHSIGGTTVYHIAYTYDDADQLVERTETVDGGVATTYTYEYDERGQVTEVGNDGTVIEQYGYDVNGNRTERTLGSNLTETATFNGLDQVTDLDGVTYEYDDNGYLQKRGADTLTYSVIGELLSVDLDGGDTIEYTYDGVGRRVARTVTGTTTEFFYGDPTSVYRVTAVRESDGTLTKYFYDDLNQLYALDRGGTWYYVGTDQVGTPKVVFRGDGTIEKEVEYDAFGAAISDSNPGFELHVGFAGGIIDAASGLLRFGYRDYDPVAGRWLAQDPALFASGQANLYTYAANDPVNLTDSNGLSWDCYWDDVMDDWDKSRNWDDTLFDEALTHLENRSLEKAARTAKDVHDTAGDVNDARKAIDRYRRARKVWKVGKSAKWAVKMAGLPVTAAYSGGTFVGSAINPVRDNSLGDLLGEELSDLVNGEGPCVKDDGSC